MKESASQYADRVIGLMISLTGIIFFVGYIIPAVDWSNVDFSWWQLLAVVNVALIFVVFAGSFFFAYRVQWLLWLVIILLFSFLLLSMFLGPAKIQMNSDVTWIWALQSAVITF